MGIFYRLYLREHEDWLTIEQQLYCTLKADRVEQLHLLCSGFHPAQTNHQTALARTTDVDQQEPVRDELLEFHSEPLDMGSTCAVLTPAIRAKLREMHSGQVLEVRVNDPSARNDVEAWSRLSGNVLLKIIDDGGLDLRFFIQKK